MHKASGSATLGVIWRLHYRPWHKPALGSTGVARGAGLRAAFQAASFRGYASGFRRWDAGLQWHRSKYSLMANEPGPVLVGTSYEYESTSPRSIGRILQARKYSSFGSHEDLWEFIADRERHGEPQNLNEVLEARRPRCLYFDLDGDPAYQANHEEIKQLLTTFVRWFFEGDRMGWPEGDPVPVVLTSSDPEKYSCHVVFPQIQFANHAVQSEYMAVLFTALPLLKVHLSTGESVPLLGQVVDRVPYGHFQLFRGPHACKLKDGQFRRDTELVPESYFGSDQLGCFASYVDRSRALAMPPLGQLLEGHSEVRELHERSLQRIRQSGGRSQGWDKVSIQDQVNLFDTAFQKLGGGQLQLYGRPPLEVYKEGLCWLHPGRASQWWSWFRLCGVTYSMLERCGTSEAQSRVWEAHHSWSMTYPGFSVEENEAMVLQCEGKPRPGLGLLRRLVRFDNPGLTVDQPIASFA